MDTTLKVREDFDRLALFDSDGWNHNNHYHPFLLQRLPPHVDTALEIGCGTGAFARLLAERADRVLALDFSPQMIRIAKERSVFYGNIEYQTCNVVTWEMPENHFDCIASIATLHHMSLEDILPKLKRGLKPGGVLLILDILRSQGLSDRLRDVVSMPYGLVLKLTKSGRLRPSRAARQAWAEHGTTDHYLTLGQVRAACSVLPGAQIKPHLLWRYSVVWTK